MSEFAPVTLCGESRIHATRILEVVMAVLSRHFSFEPSDKKVVWRPAFVIYPTVGDDHQRSCMPLRVQSAE